MAGPVRSVNYISRQDILSYPAYIIENKHGLFFRDEEDVKEWLDDLLLKADVIETHCTIYKVEADWQATVPGTDEMGRLKHIHIEKEELEIYLENGLGHLF